MEAAVLCQPALTMRLPQRRELRTTPRLSVVIVNYHQSRYTAELIEQIRASRGFHTGSVEVVVIDNHSPPCARLEKLARAEGVSLERWQRNRGFARAANEGCRLSQGDWLLLLNPDMTLERGFLDQVLDLSERCEEESNLGIVGLGLRNPGGTPQGSTGPFPTFLGTLLRLFLPRCRRKYTLQQPQQRQPVDWVCGCCLLVRRSCWEQLGGFDPSFFLYYEDIDLCQRARQGGWTVWYEPTLTATHHHPLHARPISPVMRLITRHAFLTYARKHWSGWQFRLLARIVRTEAWLRQLWERLLGDSDKANVFAQVGAVARDLVEHEDKRAAFRLQQVVEKWETRGAISALPQKG